MTLRPTSVRNRFEARLLRALALLPEPAVRRSAGRPVRIDGQQLSSQAQLLLRLMRLTGAGRIERMSVAEARAEIRREAAVAAGAPLPVGEVRDLAIPGPAGKIGARLFEPVSPSRRAALIVYFHGGGHVVGDLDTHEPPCRFLCREVAARVLSIDYRLGPEHRFPAAVEDAEAAFRWAHENTAELGVDPERIAVAGDSAGGNLAAVVANRAARAGGPSPALQVLIYPVTDYAGRRRSYELFGEGFFLTTAHMEWYRQHYFAEEADREHPDASPLREPDLSGAAPAHVVTCGFDPLRDEGEAYAERLREAAVEVTLVREPDLVHGFVNLVGLGGRALEAAHGIAAALREGLAVAPGAAAPPQGEAPILAQPPPLSP